MILSFLGCYYINNLSPSPSLYQKKPLSVVLLKFWNARNPDFIILLMPQWQIYFIYLCLIIYIFIYLFAFRLKQRMLSSITIYLSIYLPIYLSIYLSSYMHTSPSLIKSNIKPPIGTRATKAPHGRTHSSQQGQMLQQLQRPGRKTGGLQPQKWWCSLHYDISPWKHIKTYQNTYQNWDLTSTFGI